MESLYALLLHGVVKPRQKPRNGDNEGDLLIFIIIKVKILTWFIEITFIIAIARFLTALGT